MINEFLMNQKNRMKFAVSRSIDKACGELLDSAIEKGKYALREHFGTVVLYEQTRQPTQIAYKYIYSNYENIASMSNLYLPTLGIEIKNIVFIDI